jgi:probable HAF family extracellular repeat protein
LDCHFPATAAKLYSVTDLGTLGTNALGSNFSVASGINDLGQVVGSSSSNTDNLTHGFASNSLINPETDDLGFLDNSDNARFSRFTRLMALTT